ncbi:MAG: DUF1365 domain-containing protein [Planctomycetales bacterium]|nr:DUF1365 domain-containing protein [Planctomycetales bacterium]
MNSCLYVGSIRHNRSVPTPHSFEYGLFLSFIDLDEVKSLFRFPFLCSTSRCSAIQFRRSDYFGDAARPLAECVRELVNERLGIFPRGPIRLLTNLRIFGLVFNPVSFYYCYDDGGESLVAIVAEVTNTPWRERHCYVIPCTRRTQPNVSIHECEKEFHVSPFMQMSMRYRWCLSKPGDTLSVQIENFDTSGQLFNARLSLARRMLTLKTVVWTVVRFPIMPLKVVTAIYWQAFILWFKKTPFVPHPKRTQPDCT